MGEVSVTTGDGSYQAHFWLSAFAKLCREEAASKGIGLRRDGEWWDDETATAVAFNALCERFGLLK